MLIFWWVSWPLAYSNACHSTNQARGFRLQHRGLILRPSRVLRRAMSASGCSVRAIWILTPHNTIAFSRYPLELLPCQDLTLLTARGSPVSFVSAGASLWWRCAGAPRGRRPGGREGRRGAAAGRARGRRCLCRAQEKVRSPGGGLACYLRWFRCVKSVANYL
jgi:hypothetical protein